MAYLRKYSIIRQKYEADIPLADSFSLEGHADIRLTVDGYRITARENICLAGFEFSAGENRLLENGQSIWLSSGNIYYFVNDTTPKKNVSPESVNAPQTAVNILDGNKQYDDFWHKGKYSKSLKDLAGRLTAFARKRYGYERTIYYQIESGKATALMAVCPNLPGYNTPTTVLRGVYFSRTQYIFREEEKEHLGITPSMSMRENRCHCIFCFPFLAGNEVVGIFYADGTNPIKESNTAYLLHICQKLTSAIASLITPPLKEVQIGK